MRNSTVKVCGIGTPLLPPAGPLVIVGDRGRGTCSGSELCLFSSVIRIGWGDALFKSK